MGKTTRTLVVFAFFLTACPASAQTVSTVAGDGTLGYFGDGGSPANAQFNKPGGVFVDASGNIYISDRYNNRIRKITLATNTISTIAGNGIGGYVGDGGLAVNGEINAPRGNVWVDAAGNVLIADSSNNVIRVVDPLNYFINTFPGTSGAGLSRPINVVVDAAGNLFISNLWNGTVSELPLGGTMKVVAGNGHFGSSGDGGPATSAAMADAAAVIECGGNLLIADDLSSVIRMVEASTGNIKTVAGNGTSGYSGDGGPATSAQLFGPYGLTLDDSGNLFIADSRNHVIREVEAATGNIKTVAGLYSGSGGFQDGPALEAKFNWPTGLAVDPTNGNLLVADSENYRIRVISGVASAPASPKACPGAIGTTTALTSSANPSALHDSITFTATVTPAAGGPPTGKVKFMDGSSTLGTVTLDGAGVATYSTSSLTAGAHSMTAVYLGDLNHLITQGTLQQDVGAILATLTTLTPTDITTGGATSGGNITADGGATVTARGVCYGSTSDPDLGGTCTADAGTGTGIFTVAFSGLAAGMPYHVRAYATNTAGTAYGNDLTFTTASGVSLPTVSTTPIAAITTTSAAGGGNVTANGGATVTARGVCWGIAANPELGGTCQADVAGGLGPFTVSLSGLTPGQLYHARAYATNSSGTAYGNDLTFSASSGIGPYAYVTNSGDDTVTVIDTATDLVYGLPIVLPAASVPYGVAVNPAGTRVYVTDYGKNRVSVIDGTSKTVLGSPVTVGTYPIAAALNPAGTILYVVDSGAKKVVMVDTATNTLTGSAITVGKSPQAIVINPGGTRAWVPNGDDGTVSVIDLTSNTVLGSPITVGGYPQGIVINPAGTRVYVANGNDDTVSVIDAATNTTVGSAIAVGHGPTGLAIDPSGARVYVTNWNDGNSGSVSVIDTSTNTLAGADIPVGTGPVGIAVNAAGTRAYVANNGDNNVTVIDLATLTVLGTPIPVGSGPLAFGQFLPPAPITPPAVTTAAPVDVTTTTATFGGNVTADGGAPVTDRGVCWGAGADPALGGTCQSAAAAGTGPFTVPVSGLTDNTPYHVRAYATNSAGTAYGSDTTFSTVTAVAPTVVTLAVGSITTSSATAGGDVTADGGLPVGQRGVCWGTSPNPALGGSCQSDVAGGTGSFNIGLSGLTPGTPYHVRAWATNSVGTSYGGDVSFTTQVPAGVTTTTVQPASGQYSDPVTLRATVGPAGGTFAGSLRFYVAGVAVGNPVAVRGPGTYELSYLITQPEGSYAVSATFKSSTPGITGSSNSSTLSVTPETAAVTPSSANPTSVPVAKKGSNLSGSFTLSATIAEPKDGSPGTIAKAIPVTFTLSSTTGGTTYPCTAGIKTTGSSNNKSLIATCAFTGVAADLYDLAMEVGGGYYAGKAGGAFGVYDPARGSLHGAGTMLNPASGNKAAFLVWFQYVGNRLLGTLQYGEGPNPKYAVSLSSATAMAVLPGPQPGKCAKNEAVVAGKAIVNGVQSYTFQITAVDLSGASGLFGLQLWDPQGAPVGQLTFAPVAVEGDVDVCPCTTARPKAAPTKGL